MILERFGEIRGGGSAFAPSSCTQIPCRRSTLGAATAQRVAEATSACAGEARCFCPVLQGPAKHIHTLALLVQATELTDGRGAAAPRWEGHQHQRPPEIKKSTSACYICCNKHLCCFYTEPSYIDVRLKTQK